MKITMLAIVISILALATAWVIRECIRQIESDEQNWIDNE